MNNDFWKDYVPEPSKAAPIKGEGLISDPDEYEWKCDCPICEERYRHWKNDFDVQQAALREEALDKKAENARELGLDYEPADGTQVSKVWWDGEKLMAKPIPLVDFYQPVQDSTCSETLRAQGKAYPRTCRKCGLGPCIGAPKQPPAAQRQWVGLTNNELQPIADEYRILFGGWVEDFARAIEAKLKEKNT